MAPKTLVPLARADKNPSALIEPKNLAKRLVAVPPEPLTYRVEGAPQVVLKPFYQFAAGERYFMYLSGLAPAKAVK